jgi:hypothetical protein
MEEIMNPHMVWIRLFRNFVLLTLSFLISGLAGLALPEPVNALPEVVVITLVVDTSADDVSKSACTGAGNDCSLRGAIAHINADTTLPAPEYHIALGSATYTLSSHGANEDANLTGDLDIDYGGVVVIDGISYLDTIISGDSSDRVIHLLDGILYLNNLSIRYGVLTGIPASGGGILVSFASSLNLYAVSVDHNSANYDGGGVSVSSGTTNLIFSIIDHNQAPNGGGISSNNSNLTAFGAWFSNNTATVDAGGGLIAASGGLSQIYSSVFIDNSASRGGGLFNGGAHTMHVVDSVIRENTATMGGGVVGYGTISLERTEVSGNTADGEAGLSFDSSSFTLTDVTIANNTSAGGSSAFGTNQGYASLTGALDHVTITGNISSGGGSAILISSGSVRIMNSIINSTDGNDACELGVADAYLTSFDYNIGSDATCHLNLSHDHPDTDPMLKPLGNYGGISLSAPPMRGSITIDNADPSFSPTDTDQRGSTRTDGDLNGIIIPDIGAMEFLPPIIYLPLVLHP